MEIYKNKMIELGFSEAVSRQETKLVKGAIDIYGLEFTPEDIKDYSYGCTEPRRLTALQRFYFWHHQGELKRPRTQQSKGFKRPHCTRDCCHQVDGMCVYELDEFIKKSFTVNLCGFYTSGDIKDDLPREWTEVTRSLRKKIRTTKEKQKVRYRDSHSVLFGG